MRQLNVSALTQGPWHFPVSQIYLGFAAEQSVDHVVADVGVRQLRKVLRRQDFRFRGIEVQANLAEFNAQRFYHIAQFAAACGMDNEIVGVSDVGGPLVGHAAHVKSTIAKRRLPL
eukprot:8125602-Pyramimonas_sp.AAC.6